MYRLRPDAADVIGAAGTTQAEVADSAEYSRAGLNRALQGSGGRFRHATAARLAEAFANATRRSKDTAFRQLFEEIIIEENAP